MKRGPMSHHVPRQGRVRVRSHSGEKCVQDNRHDLLDSTFLVFHLVREMFVVYVAELHCETVPKVMRRDSCGSDIVDAHTLNQHLHVVGIFFVFLLVLFWSRFLHLLVWCFFVHMSYRVEPSSQLLLQVGWFNGLIAEVHDQFDVACTCERRLLDIDVRSMKLNFCDLELFPEGTDELPNVHVEAHVVHRQQAIAPPLLLVYFHDLSGIQHLQPLDTDPALEEIDTNLVHLDVRANCRTVDGLHRELDGHA
mmetsp:Transcript_86131/g.247199  ORF Transcript_86131/g.247199 Transcript_86131/m.247199 type:complete len:251 (+) Transcript_86131:263-1015(+)